MRGKGIGRVLGTADVRITPAYAGKRKDIIKSNALNRDHPRLCGEKMETGILDGQMMGSPPPMRGKDIYASDVVQQAGITPAYAGKSAPDTQWTHHIQDHPRLCGEKSRSPLWLATKIGSPPPMRGKVPEFPLVISIARITPAYAGKSKIIKSVTICIGDHPRLCGEKYREALSSNDDAGSPPPMRGKGNDQSWTGYRHRITPAYAGKS